MEQIFIVNFHFYGNWLTKKPESHHYKLIRDSDGRVPGDAFLKFLLLVAFFLYGIQEKIEAESGNLFLSDSLQDSVSISHNPAYPSGNAIRTDSLFSFRSPKGYFPSLLSNFALQASAPFHFGEKEWLISGATAGATLFLLHYDSEIDEFARSQRQRFEIVGTLSSTLTRLGGDIGIYSVIGAGLASAALKDPKGLETCILASQAVITSGVWVWMIKLLAGRERPFASYIYSKAEGGHWSGPFAVTDQDITPRRPGSSFDAFPSGHTATAFSIATVVATQYKDIRAVPVISYSLATLVGLTRLTEHEHWASDLIVGAVIGYACGKQVVTEFNRLHDKNMPSYSRGPKRSVFLTVSEHGKGLGFYVIF